MEDSLFEKIYKLEESLWIKESRVDKNHMNLVLHDEFSEIGRSGKTYSKDDSVNVEVEEFDTVLPLIDFKVKRISDDVLLTSYVSDCSFISGREVAKRSSVWVKLNEKWKLISHQGTAI